MAPRWSFDRTARWTARHTGRPAAFFVAVGVVVAWLVSGPIFRFSDTWQLVINTGTTIVTFLMVFLIQATQNRDTDAMQLKLDELIRAVKGAKNTLVDVEELDEAEIEKLRADFRTLAAKAREAKHAAQSAQSAVSAVASLAKGSSRRSEGG